ncbi:hypothetical protein BRADI_1g21430v3 [Brachypodium distachyon]|uniref:FLZ-type domain-containing protein n=1 Tax=Brachypodium distachyon TaxID=15368 RepID=I1GSD0_BRADI|nr:hypothetical protein BRADI_1g21430v3 [Brachypodium distachyon]
MALARGLILKWFGKAPRSSAWWCCHNPEDAIGILSAVKDPAAAHMQVVGPVRCSARSIMEVTLPCRPGAFLLSCGLCRHWIGSDGPVYIYKGEMGFCKEECRDEYMAEDRNRERAETQKQDATTKKTPLMDDGCIFFTCTDNL